VSRCAPAKPRILCIDDDPDISRSIELRLSEYAVKVMRGYSGTQGIWRAVSEKPDLIITDWRMPSGEGDYVLECLKRNLHTAHIPIVVLSGRPESDLPGRARHLGAVAFLRKPVPVQLLLREIRSHVRLSRKRRFN
jgi:DNA-binding response OmpR family regulator